MSLGRSIAHHSYQSSRLSAVVFSPVQRPTCSDRLTGLYDDIVHAPYYPHNAFHGL